MTEARFCIFDTAAEVATAVAASVAETLALKPSAVLGLATGKTFIPIYAEVVALYRRGGISFADATSFNLDEYIGLPQGHIASFRAYMDAQLFGHVDFSSDRTHLPGVTGDIELACERYEQAIANSGGIDLQLLGIGQNGHIGFNEPGSAFESRTRRVALTASTIEANTSDFPPGESPPAEAVTMGIGTILEAHKIALVAVGANKSDALRTAFKEAPSVDNPASALQGHGSVTVYCDRDAASKLV